MREKIRRLIRWEYDRLQRQRKTDLRDEHNGQWPDKVVNAECTSQFPSVAEFCRQIPWCIRVCDHMYDAQAAVRLEQTDQSRGSASFGPGQWPRGTKVAALAHVFPSPSYIYSRRAARSGRFARVRRERAKQLVRENSGARKSTSGGSGREL